MGWNRDREICKHNFPPCDYCDLECEEAECTCFLFDDSKSEKCDLCVKEDLKEFGWTEIGKEV